MVHLIGLPASTCTQRVLMVLAEKNVTDFTMYQPNLYGGEHKQPAHTAKQPFGAIPVLEDGDLTIFESRAICRYLAAKYSGQGTKLIPDAQDVKATALLEQWASVELTNYDWFAISILEQKLFNKLKGIESIPEVTDLNTKKLSEKLDIYDQILGKQKYMAGDEFSIVDIFYIPHTQKLFDTGDGALITDRPNVKAWWELVSSRPSWKTLGS